VLDDVVELVAEGRNEEAVAEIVEVIQGVRAAAKRSAQT
jgi:hypothetical protein